MLKKYNITDDFFCCPPMCFFFEPANEQESSLSLSKKFDSDKELLHPIFSLSKKFDSDKELLHPIFSLSKKFDSDKELLHPIFSLSKKFDSVNDGLIDSMTFFSSPEKSWKRGAVVEWQIVVL